MLPIFHFTDAPDILSGASWEFRERDARLRGKGPPFG